MLLLNRRGFSSFVVCRACGERLQCANCSVTLTYHRRDRRMLCHYCGYAEKVPEVCPKCGSDHIQFLGTGSERVEDELHRISRRRGSHAWIATPSRRKALSSIFCKVFARANSTFWWARR